MEKISAEQVAQVLTDAGNALLSVTEERDKLAAENAQMKRHLEAEKVASAMHDKGLRMDTSREDLVVELEKAASEGRLPVIQEAIEMAGPQSGFGHLTSDGAAGAGGNAFESFILGDVG